MYGWGAAANGKTRSAWVADKNPPHQNQFRAIKSLDDPIRLRLWRDRSLSFPNQLCLRREPEMNNTVIIGLVAFAAILGGAFAGVEIRDRLPKHHLTDETKNLVSVSTAVVATVSALVLGLLISNANTSFTRIGPDPSVGPHFAPIRDRCGTSAEYAPAVC
jgi:hypothetical protein